MIEDYRRIGEAFAGVHWRADVFSAIVSLAMDATPADHCLVALADDDVLRPVASEPDGLDWWGEDLPLASTIPGMAYTQQTSCLIDDVTDVRGAASDGNGGHSGCPPLDAEATIRSVIVEPLGRRGVLFLGAAEAGAFSEADRVHAEEFASLADGFLDAFGDRGGTGPPTDAIARVLSHDLKSPIQIALGHVEAAEETGETDQLSAAVDALHRIGTIADDLAKVARSGDWVDSVETVCLSELANTAWTNVQSGSATLVNEDAVTFRADQSTVCQLLENLLANAVTHAGSDATVRVGALPDGFYVEDDGGGIPESHRKEVLEWGVSNGGDGTGIGLAIVQRIADAHGWDVSITESEAGGARVEVTGIHLLE